MRATGLTCFLLLMVNKVCITPINLSREKYKKGFYLLGMLLVFLLALSAVKANESSDQDGLRKPRQLDLGLQDIRAADELLTTTGSPISLKNGLVNGYLPPIPSPSSSEVISAQSQQAFDFKSVNSVEKESELCKYPFDNEACNSKDSSVSDSKIPTPSRDLVPPIKDAEQELNFKTATIVEQANKQITSATRPQKSFSSTTEKPVTKFFKHEPNRKFTKIKATTLRSRVSGNKAEATNELRSYLPPQPEFSAAAQTNIAVFQLGNKNNDQDSDNHHHHGHHGDNFNICTDAFHSFLCAPLKARKRITGALPTRLLGESSFINYQKTLANFDRETASSNGFKNEYLPPNSFSSNLIQSTYLPPFSTNTPSVPTFSIPTARPYSPSKIFPEISNFNDNSNIPPNVDNKNSFPAKFGSLNAEYSTTKFAAAPTITANPTTFPTTSPTIPSTTASIISSTIAPIVSSTVPTISITSPSTTAFTVVSTTPPPTTPNILSTTVSTTVPPTPSSTTPNTAAPISTAAPTTVSTTSSIATLTSTQASSAFGKSSSAIVSDSFFQSVPTAQSTFNSVFSTIPVFNALPSNESRYLPPSLSPQPSTSFVSNSKSLPTITSTILPSSSSFPSFPPATFGSFPTNSIISSQKPKVLPTLPAFTSTSSSVTTPKPFIPISSFGSQLLNSKNSYLPPITQFSPSFRPSSTTLKPYQSSSITQFSSSFRPSSTTLKPYQTSKPVGQPSNSDLSYLPPDNKEPAAAQISSSALPAPQNNNPFHHGRDLCTDPFHSFLCASAKPRKKITGELPLGFKPESSNTDELRVKPEQSGQNENKIRPTQGLVGAPAQNTGYKYAKPLNSLPSNIVPPSAPSLTDYSYSKPDKTLSSSSQQATRLSPTTSTRKPEPTYRPSEAKTVTGYEYPKPDKIFPSPGGQENTKVITTTSSPSTGYSYPRPKKPFPLPTEQSEVRQKPKQKTLTSSTSNVPLPTDQTRSYQYPKSDQSLNLPDKKGYSYPKPEKKLELPGESRSKSVLPPNSSDLNAFGNLESADFIPVNKVEFKRAESSKLLTGLRKFGERMKKRERQSQLLKRQSH